MHEEVRGDCTWGRKERRRGCSRSCLISLCASAHLPAMNPSLPPQVKDILANPGAFAAAAPAAAAAAPAAAKKEEKKEESAEEDMGFSLFD